MKRIAGWALAILTTPGCALMLPRECPPGYHVHSVPTDLGPVYVCRRADP